MYSIQAWIIGYRVFYIVSNPVVLKNQMLKTDNSNHVTNISVKVECFRDIF